MIKIVENKNDTKVKSKKTTKQKIFEAAIDLFAQKGFNATSMREIAESVGIKKASLYSHYKSKDEILEKILEYPIERIGNVGEQNIGTEELIVSMGLEKFMNLAGDLVLSWMEDPYMEKIWRIICIELYHNDQIKKFYSEFEVISCSYWVSAFDIMMKHKLIKPSNPRILASEYLSFYGNAYMDYFLLNYGSTSGSFLQEYKDRIDQHVAFMVDAIKP
ncbi:MAG TPA: helix-turn-helix domain-containing protein [Methanobacterium sp.]|nr:helix-turn-helix domain-containing protein [Methanobacterium sp.]